MIAQNWHCDACGKVNLSATGRCSQCGFSKFPPTMNNEEPQKAVERDNLHEQLCALNEWVDFHKGELSSREAENSKLRAQLAELRTHAEALSYPLNHFNSCICTHCKAVDKFNQWRDQNK